MREAPPATSVSACDNLLHNIGHKCFFCVTRKHGNAFFHDLGIRDVFSGVISVMHVVLLRIEPSTPDFVPTVFLLASFLLLIGDT